MPIEKITSRKSSVVKNAAALLQKAENRSEAGLFMAEGARLCADAARSQTERLPRASLRKTPLKNTKII